MVVQDLADELTMSRCSDPGQGSMSSKSARQVNAEGDQFLEKDRISRDEKDSATLFNFITTSTRENIRQEDLVTMLLSKYFTFGRAKVLSEALFGHFGNVANIFRASNKQILSILCGDVEAAAMIKAVAELAHHLVLGSIQDRPLIANSEDVMNFLRFSFQNTSVDVYSVVFLDRFNRLISEERAMRSALGPWALDSREVLRRMILLDSTAIVVARYSRHTTPIVTPRDKKIGRELEHVCELANGVLHAFLLVGPCSYINVIGAEGRS